MKSRRTDNNKSQDYSEAKRQYIIEIYKEQKGKKTGREIADFLDIPEAYFSQLKRRKWFRDGLEGYNE